MNVEHLDTVAFVVQASNVKSANFLKYIFDSILGIFGNDFSSNIFIIATFSDGGEIQAESALKLAGVPYSTIFKFNNSALYANNILSNSKISSCFWDMGVDSYSVFFSKQFQIKPVSLVLTKKVFQKRDQIKTLAANLLLLLKKRIETRNEIMELEKLISNFKSYLWN